MDRGSDKHGPRLDEELEHETRGLTQGAAADGRAEEWREPEPSGEDEPLASLEPDPNAPRTDIAEGAVGATGVEDTVTPAGRDDRAELATYVRRSIFPANRDQLIREAESNNAPDHVLTELRRLDPKQVFATVTEAWSAATGEPEHEHRF